LKRAVSCAVVQASGGAVGGALGFVDGDGAASGVAVSAAGVAGMEGEGDVAVTRARFLGAIFQDHTRASLR